MAYEKIVERNFYLDFVYPQNDLDKNFRRLNNFVKT